MRYEFDEAIAVADDGTVDFPERWTMGPGFAHGGFLMSVALAAASKDAPKPDAVSMSAHFVRPGKVGGAHVATATIKRGRSLGTVTADIIQSDKIDVATITTFGDLARADDISFRSVPFPEMPSPDECVVADRSQNPLVPRMVDNLDVRLTPASTSWAKGVPLKDATMEGWVRFADARPIDMVSLPMFADALPPPIFSIGTFAPWTPTIEMTMHFRRRPTTEWLAVSFRTALVGGQFFESSGTLWDDDGNLVAMSRQLQLINR
jgi:acyl-CoA thioesterase